MLRPLLFSSIRRIRVPIADAKDIATAAQTAAQRVVVLNAATERDCETAFADLAPWGAGALAIKSDPFFNSVIEQLVALARRHAVPVIYTRREFGSIVEYVLHLGVQAVAKVTAMTLACGQ
jgi:hypothetical protein